MERKELTQNTPEEIIIDLFKQMIDRGFLKIGMYIEGDNTCLMMMSKEDHVEHWVKMEKEDWDILKAWEKENCKTGGKY